MNLQERLSQAQRSPEYLEERLKMTLSDAIQDALSEKGISPKQLSESSGVSHQHVLRILHDESNVTFRTVTKIAFALDYDAAISLRPLQPFPDERVSGDDFVKSITHQIWEATRTGDGSKLFNATIGERRADADISQSDW